MSALRILQRELVAAAPRTRARLGRSLVPTFEAFVTDAVELGHPMDWTLHLEFGAYCGLADEPCWRELCVGAVRRWVRLDLGEAAWLAVRLPADPDLVVIGVRPLSLDAGPKVLHGRVGGGQTAGDERAGPRGIRYQTGFRDGVRLSGRWRYYRPMVYRRSAGPADGQPAG